MSDVVNEWISQEFENLAQVLHDYDPNLALEMVPFNQWDNLTDKSKVFRVIDTQRNQIVLYADSVANPQDILGRVFSMDQARHGKRVVSDMENRNAAIQALVLKQNMDEIEAQKDFAMFCIKNTKSNWHHEGRIRDEHFRDKGPVRKVIL